MCIPYSWPNWFLLQGPQATLSFIVFSWSKVLLDIESVMSKRSAACENFLRLG